MAPFDSLRDYLAEMDRRGNLLRVPELDQDQYEMTALGYRLDERFKASAPAFQVARTRIDGRWHDTPVVSNVLNNYWTVALSLGVAEVRDERAAMYDAAVARIASCLDASGRWKTIPPVVVGRARASCKEVVLHGDDADLYQWPWIKNNPADGGRYISTGAVITEDPELGRNVGTHRMMVKGPRKVGLDLSTQSHTYKYVQRAAARGLDKVPVSVAIAIDPVSWMMSCTRLALFGEDEFAMAGGFRGKPVELVKSETNDLLVPAHAEFILEGFIPMEKEWEGPYGEMLGYVGEKKNTYSIDIHTITHRRDPIVYNVWPGIGGAYLTLPWEVGPFIQLKKIVPGLVKLHTPPEIPSVCIACIDKKVPGEGMETGMAVLGYRETGFHKKMVIVVDKDVDPTDLDRVMHTIATRWQPDPASLVVKQSFHFLLDPSTQRNFLSSKIVVDATRQFPAEGGPKQFARDNRSTMEEGAPEAFALVDAKWDSYLPAKIVRAAAPRAPFDSLRDYIAYLEAHGHLARIPEMDQDRYEMTAFAYRLEDRLKTRAPSFLVERTKVKGRWYETPVAGNLLNNFRAIAEVLGVAQLSDDESAMNKAVVARLLESLDANFAWAKIPPVHVDRARAPCKEVVLTGDDVDLGHLPWIHNNPADGGQFISAGAVIMRDPDLGRNVGTHRLQVKGPRKLGVCFTSQTHANQFMLRAKARGETSVPCSIAIGIDPISWMMSSTRLGDIGEDEFALAGGFRRKPVELVASERSDIEVPAHAEIIIEGEISIDKEPEGPYGEMLGYIGEIEPNHFIEVKAITHRHDPIVYNLWPGIGGAYLTWPWQVSQYARLKKIVPGVVRFHTPPDVPLVAFICIDKKVPGEGIETGLAALGYRAVGFSKKVVIVLDKDVDPTDIARVFHAVGTRWQPGTASVFLRRMLSIPIDPSTGRGFMSSKIIIDATRQLPAEGGPKSWPADNRAALEELAPEAFKYLDAKLPGILRGFRGG